MKNQYCPLRDECPNECIDCSHANTYNALAAEIGIIKRRGMWVAAAAPDTLKLTVHERRCSVCGEYTAMEVGEDYPYCPYCGAGMCE